jgi:hypothetical protein
MTVSKAQRNNEESIVSHLLSELDDNASHEKQHELEMTTKRSTAVIYGAGAETVRRMHLALEVAERRRTDSRCYRHILLGHVAVPRGSDARTERARRRCAAGSPTHVLR